MISLDDDSDESFCRVTTDILNLSNDLIQSQLGSPAKDSYALPTLTSVSVYFYVPNIVLCTRIIIDLKKFCADFRNANFYWLADVYLDEV